MTHKWKLQGFSTARLLEFVVGDNSGLVPKTKKGIQHVVVKVNHVFNCPAGSPRPGAKRRKFRHYSWIIGWTNMSYFHTYWPTVGLSLLANVLQTLCLFLLVKMLTTTGYHMQIHFLATHHSCTIVGRLLHVWENERDSNTYVQQLTYNYYAQHRATRKSQHIIVLLW